jgi:hypothetical protein
MKKIYTTIAAFLLIIAAIVNIRCESDKKDKAERQQQNFQYYLHINSKPYKKSLKMDTLFALRLDSIDKVNKNCK